MKLKNFSSLERKLFDIERKLEDYEATITKNQKRPKRSNLAQSIHDRKSFRKWFNMYTLSPNPQLQLVLNEKLLWHKFKETILDNSYIKWTPLITPDGRSPQMEFLLCSNEEVFYGGACGGGKTVALLAGALQYVNQRGYSALLLRRKLTDLNLPSSLLDLAHNWLDDSDVRFDSKNSAFAFPTGSRLVFGYCDNLGDEQRYRSAQFQYVGVNELTQWAESQYEFLFTRIRKTSSLDFPCRMRCASNPGVAGHIWVKERFIIQTKKAGGRAFIPARLCDNPMLDQKDYSNRLMGLNPILRAQVLDGNWDVTLEGCKFQRGWFQIVDDHPRGRRYIRIIRYWDKAATVPKKGTDPDYTVGVKATMIDGVFYILDVVRFRGTPQLNEATVRQTAEIDGKSVEIFMEQEPGSAGINDIDNYSRRVLPGYYFKGVKTTGSKELRANPLSSRAEQGNVKLLRAPWNKDFMDEFALFPHGPHDDIVDATSGAFSKLTEHIPLGGGTVPKIFR